MPSFISGGDKGIFDSSEKYLTLPVLDNPSQNTLTDKIYINVETGQLHLQHEDLTLSGLGLGTHLTRYYNSQDKDASWRICNTPTMDFQANGDPFIAHADGTKIVFKKNPDGFYVSYAGNQGEIKLTPVGNDQCCMETVATGERQYFESTGRLIAIENAASGRIQYHYENEKLKSIKNSSGQIAEIIYVAGRIEKITVQGQSYVIYAYDEMGRLDKVTYQKPGFPERDYHIRYAYDELTQSIKSVTEDNGCAISWVYENNRIASMKEDEKNYLFQYRNGETNINFNDGQSWGFQYSDNRLNAFIHHQSSGKDSIIHRYEYHNEFNYLSKYTCNDDSKIDYEYDIHGWLKKEERLIEQDIEKVMTYSRNDKGQVLKESTTQIGKGNILDTSYFYDVQFPYQPKYKMTSDRQVTEYVYNDARELIRKYVYNAFFNGDTATKEVLDAWSKQAGQQQNSHLTVYSYSRGDLSETKCYSELGSDGGPLIGVSENEWVERQETDIHGQVIAIGNNHDSNKNKTNQYDGVGRRVEKTNFFGHKTITNFSQHQDGGRSKATICFPSGLVVDKEFTSSGHIAKEEERGSINGEPERLLKTTVYHKTQQNRLYCIEEWEHPTDERRFQYIRYDGFGRPNIEFDQDGYATEYVRNKRGQIVKKIQYAERQIKDTASKLTLDGLEKITLVKTVENDRINRYVYDYLGRVRYFINSKGYIKERMYDITGNIKGEIQYAKKIDLSKIETSCSVNEIRKYIDDNNLESDSDNRITYHYYNSDGLEILTIYPNGGVIAYTRDGNGNIKVTERFANPVFYPIEHLPSSVEAVKSDINHSPEDIVEYTFHNKRNEVVAHIDGEGCAVESLRDKHGDKYVERKFYQKINLLGAAINPNKAWEPKDYGLNRDDVKNEVTQFSYDAEHRELVRYNKYKDFYVHEYSYWDDPDAEYSHSTMTYTLGNESITQYRGVACKRDCRGDVQKKLDSLGLDALLHQDSDAWEKYGHHYQFDGFRRCVKEINNQGHETQLIYNKRGDEKFRVNAEGEVKERAFNAFREVTEESIYLNRMHPGGNIDDFIQRCLTKGTMYQYYDTEGKVSKKIDEDGYVFYFEHNEFNEKSREVVSLYNDRWLIKAIDYHKMGNVKKESQTAYKNNNGEIGEVIESRIQIEKYYDTFSRVTKEIYGEKEKIFNFYDKKENKTHIRKKYPNIENKTMGEDIDYDAFNREIRREVFNSLHNMEEKHIHTTAYDANRHSKTIVSEGGGRKNIKTVLKNGFDEIIEEEFGDSQFNENRYNAEGKVLRKIKNNKECEEIHQYNTLGLVEKSINKNGTEIKFEYDKARRQIREKIWNTLQNPVAPYQFYEIINVWSVGSFLLEEHNLECKSEEEKRLVQLTMHKYSLRGDKRKTIEDAIESGIQRTTDYTHDILSNILNETISSPHRGVERVAHHEVDNFGRISNIIIDPNGLNIKIGKVLDKNNSVVKEVDGMGGETHHIYEDDNHSILTIRPSGVVIVKYYDIHKHVKKEVHFSKKFTKDQIVEVVTQNKTIDEVTEMLGGESLAKVSVNIYSADKHLMREERSLLYPVEYHRNNAGQELRRVQHEQEIMKVNDKYGHLAYEIDSLNYITRYIHDKSGNCLFEIRYANSLSERKRYTVEELDAIISKIGSEHDRFTYRAYDMMHREQFLLNAEGTLTVTQYNVMDNVTGKRVHDEKYLIPVGFTLKNYQALLMWADFDGNPVALGKWSQENSVPQIDHVRKNIFDGLGRMIISEDSLGSLNKFEYNLLDHVTKEVNRLGGITDHKYDRGGRISETSEPEREVTDIDSGTGEVLSQKNHRPKIIYRHNNNDKLIEKTEAAKTTQERKTFYEYDEDNNQKKEILHQVSIYQPQFDLNPNNMSERVESLVDLETESKFDAFSNVACRKTADGAESFDFYDFQNRLILSVDAELYVTKYIYDGYGNKYHIVRYSNSLDISARQSLHDGVSVEFVENEFLKKDEENDRFLTIDFDLLNRKIKLKEPPELYFDSNAKDAEDQYFEHGKETLLFYNSNSEIILKRLLMNPYENRYLDEYQYYNRIGTVIAQINPGLFLTVYGNISLQGEWRHKTEYSNALLPVQIELNKFSLSSLPVIDSKKDRVYLRELNGEGWVCQETECDLSVYYVDDSNEYDIHIGQQQSNKIKKIEHDAEGNEVMIQTGIVSGKPRTVCQFYNYASHQIFRLDAVRTVKLGDGIDQEGAPLTCFGYDVLNREVMVERKDMAIVLQGSTHQERQQYLISLIKQHQGAVIRDTVAFGKHDQPLMRFESNGLKTNMSYNAVKKLIKEWLNNRYYTLVQNTPELKEEQHTTLYDYSLRGYQSFERKYDRNSVTERYARNNSFGEVESEGVLYNGDLKPYIIAHSDEQNFVASDDKTYYFRNRSGMIVKSNSEDGVWKIFRVNPAGNVTAKITSQIHQLSQSKFTPKYIANCPKNDFQYTEYQNDNLGRTIKTKLPQFSQNKNPLFSTVFVGEPEAENKRNVFGNYAAIWQKPTSFNAKSRFKLKLKDSDPKYWKEYPVIVHENEMGVNLSGLVTDLYDYQIDFFHLTDIIENNEVPYASGKDVLAVVNQNQFGSKHLVCAMRSNTKMVVAGKTKDNKEGEITGLEIIHDIDPPAYVGVTLGQGEIYEANLDNLPSGTYKVRRADITKPVGDVFYPIFANDMTVLNSNTDYSAVYTEVSIEATVVVEEIYSIETDEGMRAPGDKDPLANMNHVYAYFMRIELSVMGSPDQNGSAQTFSLDVKYQSGNTETVRGRIERGKTVITDIEEKVYEERSSIKIYEEKIPIEDANDPNKIRSRVDYPSAIQNLSVKMFSAENTLSLLRSINYLKVFDADPNSTIIQLPNRPEMMSRSNIKPKKYLHVNLSLLKKEKNEKHVALKIGDKTIAADSVDGNYECFDLTELPPGPITCQYMGSSDEIHEEKQRHSNEKTYIDTRSETVKVQEASFSVTENMFLSLTPFVTLAKISQHAYGPFGSKKYNYIHMISVANKLPAEIYQDGEKLEYFIDYIDSDNRHASRLLYPNSGSNSSASFYAVMSNDDMLRPFKEYLPQFPIYDILPRFFGMYNPPIRGALVDSRVSGAHLDSLPYPSVIKNLRITNETRNMLLYNGMPYESMLTFVVTVNGFPAPNDAHPDYKKYFDYPDLMYYFNTDPSLTPDIVSMKVYYDEQYCGPAAINRLSGNLYAYSVDLRHFGIVDKSRLSFQFMSPHVINNYLVENPEFYVRSSIFTHLTVSEIPVRVSFLGSQSMYIRKWSEYEVLGMFGKKTYTEWAGENKVTSEVYVTSPFLEGEKRVTFKYILKSMTGKTAIYKSNYAYVKGYQQTYSQTVDSPKIQDINTPAQLLPYPQGVIEYEMAININGQWVVVYSSKPNDSYYYLLIKPLPVETDRIELHLQSQLENDQQHWKMVNSSQIKCQKGGVALLDATSLPIAQYQYRVRAFRADNSVIDLTTVAPGGVVDAQGYAYGKFVIAHTFGRIVQVPAPEPVELIAPIVEAAYDFKDNVILEKDAKGRETRYEYNKKDIRVRTIHPMTKVIKPDPDARLETFSDERFTRSNERFKMDQERFYLTKMFPSVNITFHQSKKCPSVRVTVCGLPAYAKSALDKSAQPFFDGFHVYVQCCIEDSNGTKEAVLISRKFLLNDLEYMDSSNSYKIDAIFINDEKKDFPKLKQDSNLHVEKIWVDGSHLSLRGTSILVKLFSLENEELIETEDTYGYDYVNKHQKTFLLAKPKKEGSKLTQIRLNNGTLHIPMSRNQGGIYIGKVPLDSPELMMDSKIEYQAESFRENNHIDTKIPVEIVENVSPIQEVYPNEFGEVVGERDANEHLHAFKRNGAGKIVTEFFPDNTKQISRQDIFGYDVWRLDPRGIEYRMTNNPQGVTTRLERGKNGDYATDIFFLDYHNHVVMHTDADGGRYLSRYNIHQQATHSVNPDNIQIIKLFDINGNVLFEKFDDNTNNLYYRNTFGHMVKNKDRGNVIFNHQYNFAMLPIESRSESQVGRNNAYYREGQRLPIFRMSHRYYSSNQLYMTYTQPYMEDNSSISLDKAIMLYRYNENSMNINERFWLNGVTLKDMVIDYSTLNRISFVADIDYKLSYYEDKAGNIRAIDFKSTDPSNPGELLDDVMLWYTFSPMNKVKKARHLRDPQGMLYESSRYRSSVAEYYQGNMASQRYFDEDRNAWITDNFHYGNQGYVSLITHSDDRETSLTHSKKGVLKNKITYLKTDLRIKLESTTVTCTPAGSLLTQQYAEGNGNSVKINKIFDLLQNLNGSRDGAGTLKRSQQEIYPHTADNGDPVKRITNSLAYDHVQFSVLTESKINLTTFFHDEEKSSTNYTQIYHTEYGTARKKVDGNDPARTAYYYAMPNKEVVYREEGNVNDPPNAKEVARTSTHQGRIIAQYERKKDEAMGRWEVESVNLPFSDNPFASQPLIVEITKENTTLRDVAKMYCFGHAEAAGWLQQQNPQYTVDEKLPIGAKISIPYGEKSQNHSYAAQLGNTVPSIAPYYVKIPKQPPSWKVFLPLAIGTVVTLIVAPQLSKLMGSKLLGAIAAGAAASAAGNLSAQAVANIVGIANSIDWEQLTASTVIGAMTAGISNAGYGLKGASDASKTLTAMHQAAMLNLAEQSYLLVTGQQSQFNWQGLVASTVMSATRSQMPNSLKEKKNLAEITEIMINQVLEEEVRSMVEGNAFRGSNIFAGAAKQIALYGVVKTTTSAMLLFSKSRQQPKMPQPPSLPKAPAENVPLRATRRKEEEIEAPSFELEQAALAQAKSQGASPAELKTLQKQMINKKYEQFLEQMIKPLMSKNDLSLEKRQQVSRQWMNLFAEYTAQFVHISQMTYLLPTQNRTVDGKSAAKDMMMEALDQRLTALDKVKGLEGTGKYFKSVTRKVDTTYKFGERMMDEDYMDSSTTSRVYCATTGVVADIVIDKGLHFLATRMASATVVGLLATETMNVAAAPFISDIAEFGGDKSQEICHKIFK